MIEFWIICALLLLAAVMFVAIPLWRGAGKNNTVARDAANLEILRDQSAEMEADLANGLLTKEQYEQGKRELEARLLDEIKPAATGASGVRHPLKVLAASLVILIPVVSVVLYWNLGNRDAMLPQQNQAATEDFEVLSGDALQQLDDKLKQNPNDTKGWVLLANSYYQQQNYKEAVRAYDNLTRLEPKVARYWADYADAYAMMTVEEQKAHPGKNGGPQMDRSLLGKPLEFLARALALDPNDAKTLALAGTAAMEAGDYEHAVLYWGRLYNQMPDKNSELGQAVAGGLAQARAFLAKSKGGSAAGVASGKERITGTVTLESSVKSKADPEDTVFVLVRAADGPPMPLAVIRKQVKDLPLKFSLDDSMSMARAKLSDFTQVIVVARVSKSGNAMPQPGDLQGTSAVIKPGTKGLKIKIDKVLE